MAKHINHEGGFKGAQPEPDQLQALLIPAVQARTSDYDRVGPDIHGNRVWDDTDIVHTVSGDGPSHLLGDLRSRFADTHLDDQAAGIVGDWNGDGRDTVGVISDADEAGDVDGTDFL